MRAALALAAGWVSLWWPGLAAAIELREGEEGFRYVEISLTGLWGGFFVFLFGITFVLIGLLLFFLWRKSLRHPGEEALVSEREEDGQVF
ncbi:MAG: hypothetical protein OEY97_06700 [Nitrospirota bacterium]|nr:hypothetical protein [Nitrospirota bacterium]